MFLFINRIKIHNLIVQYVKVIIDWTEDASIILVNHERNTE